MTQKSSDRAQEQIPPVNLVLRSAKNDAGQSLS